MSQFVIPESAVGPPAAEDPDNVPAKEGNQTPNDVIDLSLDSGSRSVKRSSSGMTDSPNCDLVSKGRKALYGVKCIGVY